jgi:hypothetical protein
VYLDILPGGKLIVPKNLTLTMNGSIRLEGGNLEVQPGGKLKINSGFYVNHADSELLVDGVYSFGTNALGVSGNIHVTYTGHNDGKPAYAGTISGVDPQDLTLDIQLYNGLSDDELADRLASFESGLYAYCNLQVNMPLTINRNFTIPANGHIAAWMPVTVATGCTVTNYCGITVYQTFENDTLVVANEITASMNLLSLFGDEGYDIRKILLDEVTLNAIVLADGAVNWDVMKAAEEETLPVRFCECRNKRQGKFQALAFVRSIRAHGSKSRRPHQAKW